MGPSRLVPKLVPKFWGLCRPLKIGKIVSRFSSTSFEICIKFRGMHSFELVGTYVSERESRLIYNFPKLGSV